MFRNGSIGQEEAQAAFPLMVQYLLPAGLRGIVVAGLLSALMGSLAGVFNACSTLFTVDLYAKWKPQATQHQLVRMGRLATGVMVLIAMAWLPVIENARGLYYYLQAVQSYFFPPMFVVFFFGVFSKRLNGKGCVAAMVVGFVLGIFRMAVDTPVTLGMFGSENGVAVGYPEHSFLWIVNNIYFQYFSLLIAFVSAVIMVGVSYLTERPTTRGSRAYVWNHLGGRPPHHSRKLGLARRAGLRVHSAVHPRGLPVLHGLEPSALNGRLRTWGS